MVMAFAIAIWLLLLAMQRGRPLYAYFSGMTAGLCLYSYLALPSQELGESGF